MFGVLTAGSARFSSIPGSPRGPEAGGPLPSSAEIASGFPVRPAALRMPFPLACLGSSARLPPLAAAPQGRQLILEFAPKMREGDTQVIALTLTAPAAAIKESDTEPNSSSSTPAPTSPPFSDNSLTHIVIAEARLDLVGMEVQPAELISEPLLPGESVSFRWSARPSAPGMYRGTVWLFLRFIDPSTKAERREAISAQSIEIRVLRLIGFDGPSARFAGALALLLAAGLGLPLTTAARAQSAKRKTSLT